MTDNHIINQDYKKISSFINKGFKKPADNFLSVLTLLENTVMDSEQKEYVGILKDSSQKMLCAVSDVQDYFNLYSNRVDSRNIDFDLRTTVESVKELVAENITSRGLDFEVSIHHMVPSLLKGEPERLRQVLRHLIENAALFTDHGYIALRIITDVEDETHATINFEIKDTGTGIEPDLFVEISKAFSAEKNAMPDTCAGLGIGLTIVKQFVQLMGGSIKVESPQGQGTRFSFSIKFEKQAADSLALFDVPCSIKGRKILIVDSDAANRSLLKEYFESWGCKYDESATAERGFEKLEYAWKSIPFDVVLIDMHLSEPGGETLAREIKSTPELSGTIIIMLSSAGKRGDVEKLEKIGVHGYLPKPTPASILYDGITMALALGRTHTKQTITRHLIREAKKHQSKILFVDPDTADQQIVRSILEKSGYMVQVEKDMGDAVAAFEKEDFQIVLLEERKGFQTLEAIRVIRDMEQEKQVQTIILVIGTTDTVHPAEQPCADDYILVSDVQENLVSLIETWVRQIDEKQNQERNVHDFKLALKDTKEIFNLSAALERAMDDKNFLQLLVQEFTKSFPEKMDNIRSFIQNKDISESVAIINSLRSSALNISAGTISDIAQELENKIDLGDFQGINEQISLIEKEYENFQTHIQTIDWSIV